MSLLLIASLAVLAMALLGSLVIMARTGETRVALLTGLFLLLCLQQGVALAAGWDASLGFDLATASALAGLGIGLLGLLSVVALGRTLGELERAESIHWESMEGVRGLTDLASRHEIAIEERLPVLLEMGCDRLGVEIGLMSRVSGGRYEVVAIHAPASFPITAGAAFDLADTFCSTTLTSERPVAANSASDVHWLTSPARDPFHFEAYLGCAIRVHGEPRGTLVFASLEPREERFTASHKDLLVLMAQWVGAEQERRELTHAGQEKTALAAAAEEQREQAEQRLEASRAEQAQQQEEQKRRESTERSGPLAAALRRARRRVTGGPRTLDLNATVSRLEKRMRRQLPKNVELVVRKGDGLAEVQAPRLPLDAVVSSLVRRAAEAMPDGGRVLVTTANHESAAGDPGVMQAVPPARYVTLTVSESSGAIDRDALDRVFVPADDVPTPGSESEGGLPLASVYRLLQRVGGDLSVEVEPGRGSRFVAFLPPPSEEKPARPRSQAPDPTQPTPPTGVEAAEEGSQPASAPADPSAAAASASSH